MDFISAWSLSYLVFLQWWAIPTKVEMFSCQKLFLRISKQVLQATTFMHDVGYTNGGILRSMYSPKSLTLGRSVHSLCL